tara:strand:- start:20205 stop:20462 length:258 start_codon:yes stop_codon:yes gene_type:complete
MSKSNNLSRYINLHYIRAAIEANTGQTLSFKEIRELLIEEGLVTERQLKYFSQDFRGYGEFYEDVPATREVSSDEIEELDQILKF